VKLLPATEWANFAGTWRKLYDERQSLSFFLSPEWTGCWIDTFANDLKTTIASFEDNGRTVGACLLVEGRTRESAIAPRRLSINATGEPAAEDTFMEHNDLLCEAGFETAVASHIAKLVRQMKWDELAASRFDPGPAYDALKREFSSCVIEERIRPCHFVNLEAIRNASGSIETILGSTSRKHFRRALRDYANLGPVAVEAATIVPEAIERFDELAEMNRRRWKGRTQFPVFSSPRFLAFHHALIRTAFATGAIDLVRVTVGGKTLGTLYCLRRGKTVYLYQSGYEYSIAPQNSPGTVTQALAIQRLLDLGYDTFDFLGGEETYKQRLAKEWRPLMWTAFSRRTPKMWLYRQAKRLRRGLSSGAPSRRSTERKAQL